MESSGSSNWRAVEGNFPLDDEPALRGGPLSVPIPNAQLRATSSISDIGSWYAIGEAWAQIAMRFMPPDPTVLDIGCGCGKMARFFSLVPNLRYLGVDLFLPSIRWCEKAFLGLARGRFKFEHFDGISEVYNPAGTVRPSDYQFPADDGSIDMTICAALFTHLLEEDCMHYLAEIRRVSKPGGLALVSIHNEPPQGKRFDGDESRIDIDEDYFLELARRCKMGCRRRIGNVYGQQVLLLEAID
jgi:SAM-dependent methyltransferase